ncbi:MAG: suppressor of fused domain protein [Candidatus Helarchaeota archaeon]|nr:suppressor of fused domain protein [Candidatus Helarchaeota archaeon]
MNIDENIKILEKNFDEYRVYGDERDLEFFKEAYDSKGPNCSVPIKVPYIYPELKNDQSNQIKLSPKVVKNAIAEFVKFKLRNWRKVVVYRRIEDKITDDFGLENNCAVPLSTYTLLNNTRRTNPVKAKEYALRILRNKQIIDNYRYGKISEKEFQDLMRQVQEEHRSEREKPRSLFQLKNDNNLVLNHIEKYVGKIEKSIHDQEFDRAPLSIHIIPKIHNQDYSALVTSGLSYSPMFPPDVMEFFKYSELIIKLPLDWPLPIDVIKDDEFFWPIRQLLSLMKYIHSNQQWFSDMHTFGNGNPPLPFAKNTKLCGFLFMFPLISFPPEFCELKIDEFKSVIFLQLVPLHKEEIDFTITESSEALLERIEMGEIPDHVDIQRKSTFASDKSDFKPSETKGYFCPYCNTILRDFKPKGVRCSSCKRVVKMNREGKLFSIDIPDEKPSVSKKERQKAEKLFLEGLNLHKQSKFEQALEIFNKAIKLNPYDMRVYSIKVEILHKMGRYKEVQECAEEWMKYQ